jgi:SAM-dependent methyltransferase
VLPDASRWNHNLQYHPWLISKLPPAPARVLDFGCGEGILARRLRDLGYAVVAIDSDLASVACAREQGAAGIDYLAGDAMVWPLGAGSFDAAISVAALHHVGTDAGLRRLASLVRPGGVVLVVGLARAELRDLPWQAAGLIASRSRIAVGALTGRRRPWHSPAPTVWPPADTYLQVRDTAVRLLPGARFRHRLLWRFTIEWTRSASSIG